MTTEQKQLLIKDLSARLSHGVRCFIKDDYDVSRDGTLYEMDLDDETCGFKDTGIAQGYWYTNVVNVKPYLRPMSSMTDEEKMYVNELIYDKDGLFLSPTPTWVINECDIDKYIDFCNSKHLDWRGLIPMGLALSAPDGMYEF